MSSLLITTFAVGRYQVYAELFRYAIKKAYPEYDVYVIESDIKQPKYYGACARFLTEEPVFHEYDYVYITDIDMMIVREPITILEFHTKEMEETGLCYSNTPRGMEERGFDRLTGLHFVGRDWWNKTRTARYHYTQELLSGKIGDIAIDDEIMLMNIVSDSDIGMVPARRDLICRHHGLHLGTVRAHKNETLQKLRRDVFIRVSPQRARGWMEVVETNQYTYIMRDIKQRDKQAHEELVLMEKFARQRSKEK